MFLPLRIGKSIYLKLYLTLIPPAILLVFTIAISFVPVGAALAILADAFDPFKTDSWLLRGFANP